MFLAARGRTTSSEHCEWESTDAGHRGGPARSSGEGPVMGSERRGRAVHGRLEVNPSGEEPTDRPRQKNAGLWEPYDGRLSRTVLREREGEVPSRHSPGGGDHYPAALTPRLPTPNPLCRTPHLDSGSPLGGVCRSQADQAASPTAHGHPSATSFVGGSAESTV